MNPKMFLPFQLDSKPRPRNNRAWPEHLKDSGLRIRNGPIFRVEEKRNLSRAKRQSLPIVGVNESMNAAFVASGILRNQRVEIMNRTDRRAHERLVKAKISQLRSVTNMIRMGEGSPIENISKLKKINDDLVTLGVFRRASPVERVLNKAKRLLGKLKFWH